MTGFDAQHRVHARNRRGRVAHVRVTHSELTVAVETPARHRTRHGDGTGVVVAGLDHRYRGEIGFDGYFFDAHSASAGGAVTGTTRLTPAPRLLGLRGDAAVAVAHAQVDGIRDPGDRDRNAARSVPAVAQVTAGAEPPARNRTVAFEGTREVLTGLHRDHIGHARHACGGRGGCLAAIAETSVGTQAPTEDLTGLCGGTGVRPPGRDVGDFGQSRYL